MSEWSQIMEWISVKDRLPSESQRILFCYEGTRSVWYGEWNGEFWYGVEFIFPHEYRPRVSPDYWMPLPEAPK